MKTNNLQLEKATNLVCQHWFPFDNRLLGEALLLLDEESESYDEVSSVEQCLSKLKIDASLYLLCLKELSKFQKQQNIKSNLSGFDVIEKATAAELRRALNQVCFFKTPHAMEEASELQSRRLTEMLISSTTASQLGEKNKVSPIMTHGAALVRQLGYTLIAWNYPKIYQRILDKPLSRDQIDREIRKYLGFSPSMIALSVMINLGFDKSFVLQILGGNRSASPTVLNNNYELINRVCDIGEALSRASSPEIYSTASQDFKFAETEIVNTLGDEGVRGILSKVSNLGLSYSQCISKDLLVDPKAVIDRTSLLRTLKEKNNYIEVLPSDLYSEVVNLYSSIDASGNKKEYITSFVKNVYPKTNFISLAVYLIDPVESILFPSLILGRSMVEKTKSFSLSSGSKGGVCMSALELTSPIREERFIENVGNVSVFAASFGDPIIGVFKVELNENEINSETMAYFKALKRVFCDCLFI